MGGDVAPRRHRRATHEPRSCEGPGCAEVFAPSRSDQRFCSPACRLRAHRLPEPLSPEDRAAIARARQLVPIPLPLPTADQVAAIVAAHVAARLALPDTDDDTDVDLDTDPGEL